MISEGLVRSTNRDTCYLFMFCSFLFFSQYEPQQMKSVNLYQLLCEMSNSCRIDQCCLDKKSNYFSLFSTMYKKSKHRHVDLMKRTCSNVYVLQLLLRTIDFMLDRVIDGIELCAFSSCIAFQHWHTLLNHFRNRVCMAKSI